MNNPGIPFKSNFSEEILRSAASINDELNNIVASFGLLESSKKEIEALVSYLDLTSLNGTDTPDTISKLLAKAKSPLAGNEIKTAAVCIYQPFIAQCAVELKNSDIQIATVAGGFPAGQMDLDVKCADIERSVSLGATEIDMVINRANPLTGNWRALYDEVKACKKSCGPARLKVIIATGELGDYTTIAKTSWVCMMAGADFIKTSTGMEKVNATLEVGFVMMNTIRQYFELTDIVVGFKPAGGIRTTEQAMQWHHLVKETLGARWCTKSLFRIGASSLLDDLAVKYMKL